MNKITVNKVIGYKKWIPMEVIEGSDEHLEILRWNRAKNFQLKQDRKEMRRQNEIAENEVSYEQRQEETGFEIIDEDEPSPEEWYISKVKAEELRKAIKLLTPRQQEMLRLVYWEGKTQDELCEIFGVKKQAISNAMVRIYASLKKILEKNELFSD